MLEFPVLLFWVFFFKHSFLPHGLKERSRVTQGRALPKYSPKYLYTGTINI